MDIQDTDAACDSKPAAAAGDDKQDEDIDATTRTVDPELNHNMEGRPKSDDIKDDTSGLPNAGHKGLSPTNDTDKANSTSSSCCASCGRTRDSDGLSDNSHDLNKFSNSTEESNGHVDINGADNHESSNINKNLVMNSGLEKSALKKLNRQRSFDNTIECAKNKAVLKTGSSWSITSSCSHCQPSIAPRENIASTRRKQLSLMRSRSSSIDDSSSVQKYMTPSQRKDKVIKDLRKQLCDTHERLQQRDLEIQGMISKKDTDVSQIMASKDKEIYILREQLGLLQQENEHLLDDLTKQVDRKNKIKHQLEEYESEQDEREEKHREMYLMMYEKGKSAAESIRMDMLEEMATENPESVSVTELLYKLKETEKRLITLQSTTRENRYHDATALHPTTDSEATLRCVRDAMFHYLTAPDLTAKKQHLNIMLSLAGFTSSQRKKIDKSLSKSKSQKKK